MCGRARERARDQLQDREPREKHSYEILSTYALSSICWFVCGRIKAKISAIYAIKGEHAVYSTAQMQGKWGSRVARKSLASHARVARKSRASCPRVTRESLSSHTQTTRVIINCTTIGLLYLYCYKPFVISITKEYYSVHFFLQPLPTNTRSPVR